MTLKPITSVQYFYNRGFNACLKEITGDCDEE